MGSAQAYCVSVRPLRKQLGGGFEAVVSDLPGCRSDGDTPQDALANAYDAIECWIDEAQSLGRAVPPPRHTAAIPGSSDNA